ncbi:54S ribosomal protein L2-like protein [Hapsidospora chrysogenum ATCC 11550]|uniref:Large ribosomal subunit protein bL27m n=1 Tax=Hapsidospora chrysogenum (strain ATCC 11550 / CBS 779.69 / DSM 880 / IAM 14645 / JCM 23072 / IMI 49137) TaxID=857340 RepID=A0A086SWG4_HAPC1|nr:54S ribosomal protein L2-like protein [Hapsidospora chrysogenum ATCC 11550]
MRFLTMHRPLAAAAAGALVRTTAIRTTPVGARLANALPVQGVRYASVKSQGAYKKKSKRGIPKKLGAKRTGDQFVIPGNIIYKQRGTLWWPGENCIMGRDFTIHSMATGYVKYYRDPARHPDRKYIGVTFNKDDVLPYPQHAERRRRLGKTAHPIQAAPSQPALSPSGIPFEVRRVEKGEPDRLLRLRSDYSYREDNWRIGQLVKTTGVRTKHFRTRKQWFRHRRWRREREIAGQKKAAEERARLGVELGQASKKPMSKKQQKQAKKAKKAKK